MVGIWDRYPVSPGHALLILRRHVATWFEATLEEQQSLVCTIDAAKAEIELKHSPDGYNIGINVGDAAGQTVQHLHVHVIPRYRGDVRDPRGGVRHVIPGKGNYALPQKDAQESAESYTQDKSEEAIFGTDRIALIDGLRKDLAEASSLDIAVAFVTASGLRHIEPYVVDLLESGGRLRLLTGDYFDVTEPRALHRMLDWVQEYSPNVHIRVFQTDSELGFHPKAYLLHKDYLGATAFIGSSNLTKHALHSGIEWNQRIEGTLDQEPIYGIAQEFEKLFSHRKTTSLSSEWIASYEKRRKVSIASLTAVGVDAATEAPAGVPVPHPIQVEALNDLTGSRKAGNRAGLVVMATGLGKTWLAAFDSVDFERVLFVAHREEILKQALNTFRTIRPDANLGIYMGGQYDKEADVLFASIQTLGRANHLHEFSPERFDYIVVDEFHHAAARTYRRLIDYFEPSFMLGLTATPERTDGGDLLALCGENLVFRCDLVEGIARQLLCPFAYFGVPDEVDFSNIPWRSGRFDPQALEFAVATDKRAQNAYEQWEKHGQSRTLAFCVSKRHADFMTDFFGKRGVKAVAVHSGPSSSPRARSLEELEQGKLQVVFAVDMFNEGVDVPTIDTVMMLRPTESKILWLQQFGRGLRRAEDKQRLNVIDYIGNHKTFLKVPALLFPNVGDHIGDIRSALAAWERGELQLPPGCSVQYELEAIEILKKLAAPVPPVQQTIHWYRSFTETNGRRPSASEAYHEGYDPKRLKRQFGSWINFVKSEGDLSPEEEAAYEAHEEFLDALAVTQMNKSFKMVTLLGMIALERFPGSIKIEDLVNQATRIANRIRILQDEFGSSLKDAASMQELLETNPIKAWVGGKGMNDKQYFSYEAGVFSSFEFDVAMAEPLRDLTRELCDYRLAQYLDRLPGEGKRARQFVCRVSHSSGNPIIFLPDREKNTGIPDGWTSVMVGDQKYQANFVKIAVNVFQREGAEENQLPSILRSFFGEDAGLPGTSHRVKFELQSGAYHLGPVRTSAVGPELWKDYMRAEIPRLWGFEFNAGKWNQGFVQEGDHMFLLVSLNKEGMAKEHQYADRFLSKDTFQWMSQNRTKRDSPPGRKISRHEEKGIRVHLFVRGKGKTPAGKAAPFVYCGNVSFVDWKSDQPINVTWQLTEPLTAALGERFGLIED